MKTIVKYFDISLIDIIKITSVAKLDEGNYRILKTVITPASINSR